LNLIAHADILAQTIEHIFVHIYDSFIERIICNELVVKVSAREQADGPASGFF
jgi:hypothetical protein